MTNNPITKRPLYLIVDILIYLSLFSIAHGVVPDLFALRLNLVAPTRQISVFFFTSNMLVKRHSDFIALGFLTSAGVMGYMGLLLINPSVIDTTASSSISFNCCWSSHFPECLYNLLMF